MYVNRAIFSKLTFHGNRIDHISSFWVVILSGPTALLGFKFVISNMVLDWRNKENQFFCQLYMQTLEELCYGILYLITILYSGVAYHRKSLITWKTAFQAKSFTEWSQICKDLLSVKRQILTVSEVTLGGFVVHSSIKWVPLQKGAF